MAQANHHVAPHNDLRAHVVNGDPCPCLPRCRGGVVLHNSYDKRELGEVIRLTLGRLGKALVGHNHSWSDHEREAFEHLELLALLHWPARTDHAGRGPTLDV